MAVQWECCEYGWCPVQVSRRSSELATVRLLSSLGWPAAALATQLLARVSSTVVTGGWAEQCPSTPSTQHGPAPTPAPAVWPPGNQWPVSTCTCTCTWSPPHTEPRFPASCNKQCGTCGVTKAAVEPDNWESSAPVLWRNVAGGLQPRPCLAEAGHERRLQRADGGPRGGRGGHTPAQAEPDLQARQHQHQPDRGRGGLRPLPLLLQHPRQVRQQAQPRQPRRGQRALPGHRQTCDRCLTMFGMEGTIFREDNTCTFTL